MQNQIQNTKDKTNFHHLGYEKAGLYKGSLEQFKEEINDLYVDYKNMKAEDEEEISKRNSEIDQKISSAQNKIIELENRNLKIQKVEITKLNEDIKNISEEIEDIKNNPSKFIEIENDKINRVVISIVMVSLTIYLFLFYSSAIHSAFFKDFQLTDTTIYQAIFSENTFADALDGGLMGALAVFFAPVLFIAIAYTIYRYDVSSNIRKSNRVKKYALYLLALGLDTILAYEITMKIYESKAQLSFEFVEPYSFSMAISNPNFWLVIGFGYLAYIVWGFLYPFFHEDNSEFEKVRSFVKLKENKRNGLENQLNKKETEIDSNKNGIAELNSSLKNLEAEKESFKVNIDEFKTIINNFTNGWVLYLSNANGKSSTIKDVIDIKDDLFNKLVNE